MRPERKLRSYDEFLLCLVELKLGLLNRNLADRFSVSESLYSNISHCWLRAIALYLQYFIYMSGIGMINVTSPKRFHQYRNLIGINLYRNAKGFGVTKCNMVRIRTPQYCEVSYVHCTKFWFQFCFKGFHRTD